VPLRFVRHDVDGGVFHGLVSRRAKNGKQAMIEDKSWIASSLRSSQ
jgi:hypothetical protein